MRNSLARLLAAVVLIAAPALAACGGSSPSGSGNSGTGDTLDPNHPLKITVVAEWSFYAAHLPVVAALQNGYYKELGLDVDFIAPANAGDQIKYVTGGRAEIGLSQPMDVVLSRAKGIPVKMVGSLFDKNPTGLLVNPDAGITNIAGLAGKTIGDTGTPDGTGSIATVLATAHIQAKTANVGESGIPVLLQGKIQALHALYSGEYALVTAQTGRDWPFFRYSDYGVPDYPLLSWFTSDKFLASNHAAVTAFLKGTIRGTKAVSQDSGVFSKALKFVEEKNNAYTPAQHEAEASKTAPSWSTNASIDPSVIDRMVQWMTTVTVDGKPWLDKSDARPAAEYLDAASAAGVSG